MVAATNPGLTCPKCRTIRLKSPSSGTPVLRCYACHGMWVTLEEAQALATGGTLLDPVSLLPQKASGDAIAGVCPKGHGILIRARVELEESFYLERCGQCQGLWFDAGDWAKLASSHLIHHLKDLWDPDWQRRMREERAEERHRSRLRELLGPELFRRLDAVMKDLERHPRRTDAAAYIMHRLR
jgi:Zn-finger nucleic acid-binding protein